MTSSFILTTHFRIPFMLSSELECYFLWVLCCHYGVFLLNCWLAVFVMKWTGWDMTQIIILKMGAKEKSTDYSTQNGLDTGNFSLHSLENVADKFRYLHITFCQFFSKYFTTFVFHNLMQSTKIWFFHPSVYFITFSSCFPGLLHLWVGPGNILTS